MTKKSFVLHHDSLSILKKLSNEQAGLLFKAIADYNINGIIDNADPIVDLLLTNFINQFERDQEKWLNIAERNKFNGSKGGRPKTQNNPENPVGYLETQNNPDEPRKPVSVSVNVSDSVNENVNNTTPTPSKIEEDSGWDRDTQFIDFERQKKISEGSYQTWLMILKEYDIKLTDAELNALRGYVISKSNLPVHIIKANCITIGNWIENALDVAQGLLTSVQYKGLTQPRMMIKEDARGNRLNRDACIKKRQEQIISEGK